MKFLFKLIITSILFISSAHAAELKLEKAWETDTVFKLPESVVYDEKRDVLYVSNINEEIFGHIGNGFISKVSTDGKIIDLEWALGMDAPKGLAISGDKLYASDINALVEIDIETGKVLNRYVAPAAVHLNDVAVDSKGHVYVADTMTDSIYRLNGIGLFPLWLNSAKLEAPNGLFVEGDNLIIGSWGHTTDGFATKVPGHLKTVSLIDKSIKSLGSGKPVGNLDGVESDGKGGYFVTDWIGGKRFHIKPDGDFKVLLEANPGAADHEVILEKKLILIPFMKDGKLIAYKYSN